MSHTGAELSGCQTLGAEISRTGAEVSWCRIVTVLKCLAFHILSLVCMFESRTRGAFLLGESGTCFTSVFQKTKSWFVALKNGMFQNYVSGNHSEFYLTCRKISYGLWKKLQYMYNMCIFCFIRKCRDILHRQVELKNWVI
jgi:hypothetical protein